MCLGGGIDYDAAPPVDGGGETGGYSACERSCDDTCTKTPGCACGGEGSFRFCYSKSK